MLWKLREGRPHSQRGQTKEDILEEGAFALEIEELEGGFGGGDGRESKEGGGKGRHRCVEEGRCLFTCFSRSLPICPGRKEILLPSNPPAIPLPHLFPLPHFPLAECSEHKL